MFKIEDNVPLPKARRKRGELYKTADALEVGQSFYVSDPPRGRNGLLLVITRLSYLSRKTGKKFTSRAEGDGARVWRIV